MIGNVFSVKPCLDACNTFAYLINKHIVVKFAKNDKKLEKLILEANILNFLKNKISLKIPQINIFKNNFTFSAHEMIKGETLSSQQYNKLSNNKKKKFCYDIALFMYELHNLTNEIKTLNVPYLKGLEGLYPIDKIKDFFTKSDKLTLKEQEFVANFCDTYIVNSSLKSVVFGHFDIQPKNIAYNFTKNEIEGIYDFGDCGFCDTSYDFTKLAIQYNSEILNNVLKEYEKFSGLKFCKNDILLSSTYCVLHCLMKDIENKRSLDRGLFELKLKMS